MAGWPIRPIQFTESPNSALSMNSGSTVPSWLRGVMDFFGGGGGGAPPPSGFAQSRPGYGQPRVPMGVPTTPYTAQRQAQIPGAFDWQFRPPTGSGFYDSRQGWYPGQYDTPASERPLPIPMGTPGAVSNRRPYQGYNIDPTAEAQDILGDYWQEQMDRYKAGLAATESGIRAEFSPRLDALNDELSDLRAAAAKAGVPFDEYMERRMAIGGDVPLPEKLSPSVKPAVNKVYDDASKEVRTVLDQIDANYGPKVTKGLVNRMHEFENVIEDVLRTDEAAADLLHQRGGEYAAAMARAAYSNDLYAALDAEAKINAQLDARITETQEDVAREKKALADALAAAREKAAAEFQMGEPKFDEVVNAAWNEYFEANNIPQHERETAIGIFGEIMKDPTNAANETGFRRGMYEYFNGAIMNSLGLSMDDVEERVNANGDDSILRLMTSQDFKGMFERGQIAQFQEALTALGYDPDTVNRVTSRGMTQAEKFIGVNDAQGTYLRNMYTQRNRISTDWEEIIASYGPRVDSSDIYQSSNGYTFPVVGDVSYSNSYGYRRSKSQVASGKMPVHQGIDIMASRGSPIVSPVSGTVISIDYGNVGGRYVKVRDSKGYVHYFAHMDSQSSHISTGTRVQAGTVLGTVGNTGNARDTSPHLHYAIYAPNGSTVNPYNQLRSTGR